MIYINPIDEYTVWVTSDDDAVGVEVRFDSEVVEEERAMIALAEFLGCDLVSALNFETMDGITWSVKR